MGQAGNWIQYKLEWAGPWKSVRVNESPHPARLGRGLHHERTNHTPEQNIRKLKTADKLLGQSQIVAEACRVLEVFQPTFHRLGQLYGGIKAEEAEPLTQLENENARLKRLLAEAEHDKEMLKDLTEGNF
jgi:putative transposase